MFSFNFYEFTRCSFHIWLLKTLIVFPSFVKMFLLPTRLLSLSDVSVSIKITPSVKTHLLMNHLTNKSLKTSRLWRTKSETKNIHQKLTDPHKWYFTVSWKLHWNVGWTSSGIAALIVGEDDIDQFSTPKRRITHKNWSFTNLFIFFLK